MWQLQSDQNDKRIYTNSTTGSKCQTTKVYQDKEGNDWWEFDSLTAIPYTRSFAATKISSLYSLGLTKDDIDNHIAGLKKLLKSTDSEKYEKSFAMVLDFETKANAATDIVRQLSSLVPVYFTINDEQIDAIDNNLMIKKLSLLEADMQMHSFFLKRLSEATESYMSFLNKTSAIALVPLPEISDHLP